MITVLDSEENEAVIKAIIGKEVLEAIRVMGSAKNWSDNELLWVCNNITDGLLARAKFVSLSTVLLFFKMRRAMLFPCDKPTFGMQPTVILQNFNEFIEWQKAHVADAERVLTSKKRQQIAGGNSMTAEMLVKFQEVRANNERNARSAEASRMQAKAYEVQLNRLSFNMQKKWWEENPRMEGEGSLVYSERAKLESQKLVAEFIEFHEAKTASELQQLVDEYFPVETKTEYSPIAIELPAGTIVEGSEEWAVLRGEKCILPKNSPLHKARELYEQSKNK